MKVVITFQIYRLTFSTIEKDFEFCICI